MTCVCGHSRSRHVNTGWPRYEPLCDSFTCCGRKPDRSPGRGGSEHDFVTHEVTRCRCKEYQPTNQGAEQ